MVLLYFIRDCNNLTIPLFGSQFSTLPVSFYTLLATTNPPKQKHGIVPKSGKNNGNFLRATLITLRASSYSPVHDIKNQDNLLRQGEQLHTNCIMSKLYNNKMKHDCVVFLGFELISHIAKTLYTDKISCGLRCLQDKNANLTTANPMLVMQSSNVS